MTIRTPVNLIVLTSLLLFPRSGSAQSATAGSIAGVVRDATGAVLPGVTVEAASPALIEKVRTVVTDGEGQYKISELRPGTYTVTFTLAGFSTVKTRRHRADDGVHGDGEWGDEGGRARGDDHGQRREPGRGHPERAHAERAVPRSAGCAPERQGGPGARGADRGRVASRHRRSSGQDVGGNKGEQYAGLVVHGSRQQDGRFLYDGMRFNMMVADGGGASKHFFVNQNDVQEIVLETSGMAAETDTGGVQVNVVPKSGGNTFKGNFTLTGVNDKFQSANLTDALRARGLTNTAEVKQIYDVGGGLGGPIKQGQVVVLYGPPVVGQPGIRAGELLQQDPGHAGLHAGSRPPRLHGLLPAGQHAASDLAGARANTR